MKEKLGPLLAAVKDVYKRFQCDKGPLMAAALSFFTFLSLIPLLGLIVSIFGYLASDVDAKRRALESIQTFFPSQAKDLSVMVQGLIEGRSRVGGFAIVGLMWTTSAVFLNIEQVLNTAWDVKDVRPMWKARLIALGVMLLAALTLLLSTGASWVLKFIKGMDLGIFGSPGHVPFVWDIVGYGIGLVASVGLFLIIYKLVPDAHVAWKPAIVGAIFAGICFELAKQLFGWYLSSFGNYNKVYGSLGTLVILVTWIYYSATILILGAEVTDVYADRTGCKPAESKLTPARPPRTLPQVAATHPR